jgi:hypothetical protein
MKPQLAPYTRPASSTTLRGLALLCLALAVTSFVVAISTGTPNESGPVILAGLGLWVASTLIDYAARTAYQAERAADSLLRMEWVRQNAEDAAEEARKKAHLDAMEAEARRLEAEVNR